MVRNILIGTFAAILVVALGTAAYNVIGAQAQGAVAAPAAGNGYGNGNGGQGNNPQATPQASAGAQGHAYGGGNGNAGAATNPQPGVPQVQAQANMVNVSAMHGTVSSYAYGTLTIVTDDGQTVGVQLGNQNYVASLGFAAAAGQGLTVTGFPGDQGLFTATQIVMDDGTTYTFRESTGRPAWAGGKGNGGGGNH